MITDLGILSTQIEAARVATTTFNTYKFGYLGEINEMHNTSYPLILLMPPSTRQSNPFKNDETYNCKFYCYDTYDNGRSGGALTGALLPPNYSLENKFDLLQNHFLTLIEVFCANNEHNFIITGSWDIERVSHEFNDNLVGIEVSLQIQGFRHCLKLSNSDPTYTE